MSLAFKPLKPVKVLDPRINFENDTTFSVVEGAKVVTIGVYPANGSTGPYASSSVITFNVKVPENTIVSRRVAIRADVKCTIGLTTAPTTGNACLLGQNDAPRAFPIHSTASSIVAKLNNSSVQFSSRDLFAGLSRINSHEMKDSCNTTPKYLDTAASYETYKATQRNPLGSLELNADDNGGRGSFPITSTGNTTTASVNTFTITEPLMFSPFSYSKTTQGFVGVQSIDITVNCGDLSRMWSRGVLAGSAGASVTTEINNPKLVLTFLTPSATTYVPRSLTLPYTEFGSGFSSDCGAKAVGASFLVQSTTLNLTSIPKALLIFCRVSNTDQTFNSPDTFASFASASPLSLTVGTQSGLLGSASNAEIYEMSRTNGVDMSWQDWSGSAIVSGSSVKTVGSVALLQFGRDIQLDESQSAGKRENIQVSVQANFVASHASGTPNYTLYVVPIMTGVIQLDYGTTQTLLGVVSEKDVIDCTISKVDTKSGGSLGGGSEMVMSRRRGGGVVGGALLTDGREDGSQLGGARASKSGLMRRSRA